MWNVRYRNNQARGRAGGDGPDRRPRAVAANPLRLL